MERLIGILKIAASGAVVLFIALFIILFYESGKAEKDYQDAIAYMHRGDWGNALTYIQQVPYYKDASNFYIYIYPHKFFYDKYNTDEDAVKGYKAAVLFIDYQSKNLNGENKEKFLKDLQELKKVLNFKINEYNLKLQYETVQANFKDAVEMIKQGNLQKAVEKLNQVNSFTLDIEKQELLRYINLLNAIKAKDNNAIMENISTLDPNYSGDLSADIKKTVQSYVDINKWISIYKGNGNVKSIQNVSVQNTATQGGIQALPISSAIVTAGMKKEDVIKVLGSPVKENIISNKYGTYEEMIYSGSRYIYLENNIVTVIKG